MDWSNERYVRLYTRDTATWKLLDWRARTVLLHMFRKVDRAGMIDVGDDGIEGLAAVLELPLEIVEAGIEQLGRQRHRDREPTVVHSGSAYVFPNFIEAQETPQSDPQRKRESRARRRDLAVMQSRFVTDAAGPLALPPGSGPAEGIEDLNAPSEIAPDPSRFVTAAAGFVPQPGRPVTSGHSYPDPVPTRNSHTRARDPRSTEPHPTPKPDPRPVVLPSSWKRHSAWWQCMLDAHDRLRAGGVKPATPDLARHPNEQALVACERFLREAGYDDAGVDEKMRHVVLVYEAEAERLQHLDYFKPALIWDTTRPDRFPRKVDTTLEEARRGPQRAPARSAEPQSIRVVRDYDDDAPPPEHPAFRARKS